MPDTVAGLVPFSTFLTASELRTQLIDSDVEILLAARSHRNHDYADVPMLSSGNVDIPALVRLSDA